MGVLRQGGADPIQFYQRGSDEIQEEIVLGESLMRWAYQRPTGKLFSGLLFRCSILSRIIGVWFDSPFSKGKIRKTIDELEMDESEFRDATMSYDCFNAFFTRHLKPEVRPVDMDSNVTISPADGRVLVFPELDGADVVPVKGCRYSIDELLGRPAPEFHGGALAVVRLCPADYHRFHYPADGSVVEHREIPGQYHSVNPIALGLGLRIFTENKRSYSILKTERFGAIAIVEVGAFGVGSIKYTNEEKSVEKMDERGYFTFGGSTMILVFEPDRIQFSEDLIANSQGGFETLVLVGQPLACSVEV